MTSPLFRGGDVRAGRALAIWYVVGTTVAGAVILAGIELASNGVSAVLPAGPRYLGLAACVVVLLVLDALGRTPRWNRQTPQRLRMLPPGLRGFLWGLDIGLLFTTIKVTSLVWVLVLWSVAEPRLAPLALVAFYSAFLATEAVAVLLDLRLGPARVFGRLQGPGFRRGARVASVAVLLPVVAVALTRVW